MKILLLLTLITIAQATEAPHSLMDELQRQNAADKKELKVLKEKIFNGTASLKEYLRAAGIILRHL